MMLANRLGTCCLSDTDPTLQLYIRCTFKDETPLQAKIFATNTACKLSQLSTVISTKPSTPTKVLMLKSSHRLVPRTPAASRFHLTPKTDTLAGDTWIHSSHTRDQQAYTRSLVRTTCPYSHSARIHTPRCCCWRCLPLQSSDSLQTSSKLPNISYHPQSMEQCP